MKTKISFWAGWLVLGCLMPVLAAGQDAAKKPDENAPKDAAKKGAAEKDAKDAPKKDDKDAKKPTADKDAKEMPKKTVEEKEPPKEKLTSLGKITGKLQRVEGSQKYITVQLEQRVPQISYGSRPSVSYKTQYKSIDVTAADDLKVRSMRPPPDFDDKGKPRRYTQKELQDLKGADPKLPGYSADFDSLKPNQVVTVYLATRKTPAELKAAAKGGTVPTKGKDVAKGKGRDIDEADVAMDDDKPLATMIVILMEPVK